MNYQAKKLLIARLVYKAFSAIGVYSLLLLFLAVIINVFALLLFKADLLWLIVASLVGFFVAVVVTNGLEDTIK